MRTTSKTGCKTAGILPAAVLFGFLFALLCVWQAKAENVYTDGDYKYTVAYRKARLEKYIGSNTSVTVPGELGGFPVTEVASYAFFDTGVVSVVLPDCIEKVDLYTFEGCRNLVNVHLPAHLTEIPMQMFNGCEKLENVNIPKSVMTIGKWAFENCKSLKEVDFYGTEVKSLAFFGCTSLKSFVFHSQTGDMGMSVFKGCSSLEKVILPESGMTELGESFFEGCASLKSVKLPSSLTMIGSSAFANTGLESIVIPAGVSSSGYGGVFEGCKSLKSVTFDCMGGIGPGMFEDCVSLENVTIGPHVTSIDDRAFYGTRALASLTIPANVKVTEDSFKGAEGLTTIYGYRGSTAESAAKAVGLKFVSLDKKETFSLTLNKKKATLYTVKGKNTITLKATVTGSSKKLTWKSSKKSVATVNSKGKVTAKKAGTTTITATVGSKKVTCKITVKKPSFKLTRSSVTLKKKKTYTIRYKATPSGKVTFSSSQKSVATVNARGKITAKKKGKAIIRVHCNGVTRSFRVTVK